MTQFKSNAGDFGGRFKLETRNHLGEVTQESHWINNLITDYGLNFILASNNMTMITNAGTHLAVGTSSSTPLVTDVSLGAQLGARITAASFGASINSGPPLYYTSTIKTHTFAQGAIVGNIAEVGLFSSATGNTAATRALVRDSNGTPTTFTVLAGETLTVTYELRFYPNLTDTSGTFLIGSTTYNYTQRSKYITGNNGGGIDISARGHSSNNTAAGLFASQALPTIGISPSGTRFQCESFSYATYTNNSFTLVETVTWGPTAGNVPGGVGFCEYGGFSFATSNNQGFFMTISPVINKTNLQTLTLTFSITYGRRTI